MNDQNEPYNVAVNQSPPQNYSQPEGRKDESLPSFSNQKESPILKSNLYSMNEEQKEMNEFDERDNGISSLEFNMKHLASKSKIGIICFMNQRLISERFSKKSAH